MARQEAMKLRTVRAGGDWDKALKITKARGVDLSAVVREFIAMYVKVAELEQQPPAD